MHRKITVLFSISLLLIAAGCFYRVGSFYADVYKVRRSKDERQIVMDEKEDKYGFTTEMWSDLKATNEDFVCYILFPYDWISEPVVQGHDNQFYLNHDPNGTWCELGTIFMDSQNSSSDRNITIYGHNVFMEDDLMFSPLTALLDQEDYDEHHSFRVYWEDYYKNYEITHVCCWDEIYDRDFDYKQNEFYTDDEFNEYLNWLDQHNEIVSGESLDRDSSFLSLQTCKDFSSSMRIIITAKEVSGGTY